VDAQRYDLVILGGGTAALEAARTAARRGRRVALTLPEPDETQPEQPTPFQREMRIRQARLGLRRSNGVDELPGVDVFRGPVSFCRYRTVRVGDRELLFRRAIIATCEQPGDVTLHGAARLDCLRPETLDRLTTSPERIGVIGSDGEACYWAQVLARAGSRVYLIDCRDALAELDPEAARAVHEQLARDGVSLHLDCTGVALEPTGHLAGVLLNKGDRAEKLLLDHILAVGFRRPRLEGLALRTAAVASTERGVIVDDRLRTTARGIFAAGACCGPAFADRPWAEASGRLAARNAIGLLPHRLDAMVVPRYSPTEPMFVQLGLTRGEAVAQELDVRSFRVDLDEADEGVPAAHRRGFVAVNVLRRGGRLIGVTAVAEDADELVAPLELLMLRRSTLAPLHRMICCRPSRIALLARLAEQWGQ